MNENSSKQVLLSVLGVAILVVAVVGVSFAAFSYSKTGEQVNTVTTGTITMNYTEDTNGINITNAMPTTDDVGKALTEANQVFDFTVSSSIAGTTTINYKITATKEADSTLADSAVKVYLTSGTGTETQELAATKVSALTKTLANDVSGAPADQYILKTGTVTGTGNTTTYRLRMWVADDFAVSDTSQTYKLRVNVYGSAAAQ